MRARSLLSFWLIIGGALLTIVLICLLPTSSYLRWQSLAGTDFVKLRTHYERIHYDPRPVDAAILGPSSSAIGVSITRIRSNLKAAGINAEVENFSVPAVGRDKDYAILKELYKTKQPRIVMVQVDAEPMPFTHPAFRNFADTSQIVVAPAVGLHDQPANLLYLPYRQLHMWLVGFSPETFGYASHFDQADYDRRKNEDYSYGFTISGKHVDTSVRASPQTLATAGYKPYHYSRTEKLLLKINEGGDHEYIRKIVELTRQHGSKLIFVYIPNYHAPALTKQETFLRQFGPVVELGDMAQRGDLYMDGQHFNRTGAVIASDRISAVLAAELKRPN